MKSPISLDSKKNIFLTDDPEYVKIE